MEPCAAAPAMKLVANENFISNNARKKIEQML
jgi:hypothetical protein